MNTIDEALTSAQVLHRGLFLETDDYRGVGVPISLSDSGHREPRPAAAKGTHTDEVLEAMGYDPQRLASLRTAGVFGDA